MVSIASLNRQPEWRVLNRAPVSRHPDNVELLDKVGGRLIGGQLLGDRMLVVFDGRCRFCNKSVRWLLRRDRHDRLRFVPFESPQVADLLRRLGLEGAILDPSSILAIRPASISGHAETVLMRSDAAVALLQALPTPWPFLAAVLSWVPRRLRDWGYRLVARARFRLGGRLETCPIPTPDERARFVGF